MAELECVLCGSLRGGCRCDSPVGAAPFKEAGPAPPAVPAAVPDAVAARQQSPGRLAPATAAEQLTRLDRLIQVAATAALLSIGLFGAVNVHYPKDPQDCAQPFVCVLLPSPFSFCCVTVICTACMSYCHPAARSALLCPELRFQKSVL